MAHYDLKNVTLTIRDAEGNVVETIGDATCALDEFQDNTLYPGVRTLVMGNTRIDKTAQHNLVTRRLGDGRVVMTILGPADHVGLWGDKILEAMSEHAQREAKRVADREALNRALDLFRQQLSKTVAKAPGPVVDHKSTKDLPTRGVDRLLRDLFGGPGLQPVRADPDGIWPARDFTIEGAQIREIGDDQGYMSGRVIAFEGPDEVLWWDYQVAGFQTRSREGTPVHSACEIGAYLSILSAHDAGYIVEGPMSALRTVLAEAGELPATPDGHAIG